MLYDVAVHGAIPMVMHDMQFSINTVQVEPQGQTTDIVDYQLILPLHCGSRIPVCIYTSHL